MLKLKPDSQSTVTVLKDGNTTLALHHPDVIVLSTPRGLSPYSQSQVVKLTQDGFHVYLEPMGCKVYVPLTYDIAKVMNYIGEATLDLTGASPCEILPEY